jgi:hypothetical protein
MAKILFTRNIDASIQIVLGSVDSANTVRAYRRALLDFIQWYMEHDQGELSKAVIQSYALELKDHGMNAGNINIRFIAIRRRVGPAEQPYNCASRKPSPANKCYPAQLYGLSSTLLLSGNPPNSPVRAAYPDLPAFALKR